MSKYVSKFNILGEDIQIRDSELAGKLNVSSGSRLLTVGKFGAQFTTINDAIAHARTLNPTKNNPVTIFIYSGKYNEQIVIDNIHGLSFIGCGVDKTIIEFNGNYPDCVIHAQGDYLFKDLTIHGLNTTTYSVHVDPGDTTVSGKVAFENCRIYGGSSAIGYGSGANTELYVSNCILEGAGTILYAHNSAYEGKANQKLTVVNNIFVKGSESYYMTIDDAGNSYGVTSQMLCVISGNTYTYTGYGKMLFRKNTFDTESNLTYLPRNDSNMLLGPSSCSNNGMEGVNFDRGKYDISCYITLPNSPDTEGDYVTSVYSDVDSYAFFDKNLNVILPGVGDVTPSFTVTRRGRYLEVKTSNNSFAGKSLALSLSLETV